MEGVSGAVYQKCTHSDPSARSGAVSLTSGDTGLNGADVFIPENDCDSKLSELLEAEAIDNVLRVLADAKVIAIEPTRECRDAAYRTGLCIDCQDRPYSPGRPRCEACHRVH